MASAANLLALVVVVLVTLYLLWVMQKQKPVGVPKDASVVPAAVSKEMIVDYGKIVGNQWIDRTGKHAAAVFIGRTSTTNRFGGGFATNSVTDGYIDLPMSVWHTISDGMHWTLNTWMEIRSVKPNQFFHGVTFKAGSKMQYAFAMSATNDYEIRPFAGTDSRLTSGAHARFEQNVVFMLTVVRDGEKWIDTGLFHTRNKKGLAPLHQRKAVRHIHHSDDCYGSPILGRCMECKPKNGQAHGSNGRKLVFGAGLQQIPRRGRCETRVRSHPHTI